MKKKLIFTTLIVTTILILNITFAYGFSVDDMTGKNLPHSIQNRVDNTGQEVIKIISTVGSICSVIFLIVLGIKYMLGSAEEKAEYKKSLLPYFIGACVLFGASGIASIIYNIAIDL